MKKFLLILFICLPFLFFKNVNATTFVTSWAGPVVKNVISAQLNQDLGYTYGFQRWSITTNSASQLDPVRVEVYPVGKYESNPNTVVKIPSGATVIRFQAYAGYGSTNDTGTLGVSTGLNVTIRTKQNTNITCYPSTAGSYSSFECPIAQNLAGQEIQYFLFEFIASRNGFYMFGVSDVFQFFNEDIMTGSQSEKNTQEIIDNQNQNAEQAHKDAQAQVDATNKNTQATEKMNDTISDSNVDVDGSFFSGFDNDTHGLTSIITAPLQLIGSITSSTCTPLGIPVPFVNQTIQLPCMGEIYKKHFGTFLTLYQTITFGLVSYWVCVRLFFMVKGFKDPNSDKIEVMDL